MAYTINLTNGSSLIPGGLSDGTTDTTHTSLVLIGKDFANYGQFLNDNFVRLLENFANTSSPANPLKGQLWWDQTNNVLKVYSGQSWKISTGATSAPFVSPPTDLSALGGDLWFDTTNNQLKVYSGSSWITVGPAATTATGNTGVLPTLMTDTSGGTHIVLQLVFNNSLYAVISKDTFTTSSSGFSPTMISGINFSTSASPSWGISTQSQSATAYTIAQRDSNGGLTASTVYATTGIVPTANNSVNLGSTSAWFNNVYGTSLHAQYADLAERFEADAEYEPGTVVEMGGPAEITAVGEDLSESVFGVISTNAGYLMNSRAGDNKTHPPVAVQGRVPVKVIGKIKKGDRLVSAGNGLARAGKQSELTTWNVIGRSLENKTTLGQGVIEAAVKMNS